MLSPKDNAAEHWKLWIVSHLCSKDFELNPKISSQESGKFSAGSELISEVAQGQAWMQAGGGVTGHGTASFLDGTPELAVPHLGMEKLDDLMFGKKVWLLWVRHGPAAVSLRGFHSQGQGCPGHLGLAGLGVAMAHPVLALGTSCALWCSWTHLHTSWPGTMRGFCTDGSLGMSHLAIPTGPFCQWRAAGLFLWLWCSQWPPLDNL